MDQKKAWGDPKYMQARWEALCEMAQDCQQCALHANTIQKVIGDPNEWSGFKTIVFIGEAPGMEEEIQGSPFVGVLGQRLRGHIAALGLPEGSFGIMDMVQCRPPGDRSPKPMEINACSKFFFEKLMMWEPRLIVPLGNPVCKIVYGTSSFQLNTHACMERKTAIKHGSRSLRVPSFPMPHASWGVRYPDMYAEMWVKLKGWLSSHGVGIEQAG